MRRLLLSAALWCAGACSLLVSFDDLHFENPPAATANVGSGGQGGAPGTGGEGGTVCEGGQVPWRGGDEVSFGVAFLGKQPDAVVHAAATDGQIVYVGGALSATPIVARFDPTNGALGPQIAGNNVGTVTALAAKPYGVFFAGVAEQVLNFAGPCSEAFQTGLFVAEWNTNNTCSVIHSLGGSSATGDMTAAVAVADGQAVVVAGQGIGPNLECDSATQFQHFIARYGTSCEWSHMLTLGSPQEGIKAAANLGMGAIVVAGSYESEEVSLAGCQLGPSEGVDAFVAVLQSEQPGNCLFASTFPSEGTEIATALAVDPVAREIYVAGRYDNDLDFGDCSEPLPSAGPAGAAFVAKLRVDVPNRSAQVSWARGIITDRGGMDAGALAFFGQNDLRLGGNFIGMADFGGMTIDNPTNFGRIFVTKLDAATGQHLMTAAAVTNSSPADDDDIVRGMMATSAGDMVFAGSFQGDTPLLGNESMRAAYAVKVDLMP